MRLESLRNAYGQKVVELAKDNKNIVSLEADLGKSTMSCLMEMEHCRRFFEMNIAEQNMASFAAGLSLTGKIPFINSFAMFVSGRAYEQIRQGIGTAHLNVKICGSSSGLSDFGDGATHQCIEDIAVMRSIPGMVVIEPVDGPQTRAMVETIVDYEGPVYFRINRADLPVLTREGETFEIGKIYEMKEGHDAVIFATGIMVSVALDAAQLLEQEGISLRVLNVSTLKPLDHDYIESFTTGMKAVLTAEEHSLIGGLNSIVCQAIAGRYTGPVKGIGIDDRFGFSTLDYDELLACFGLTDAHIAEAVRSALK